MSPTTSVAEKTGHTRDEWFAILDKAGALEWDYAQTVAYFEKKHRTVSAWWRQKLIVEYEIARNKRAHGQVAGGKFQVGVSRTVAASKAKVWKLLTSEPELWLGAPAEFKNGAKFERGEMRVVKPGEKVRLSWLPAKSSDPVTLQVTLTPTSRVKTAIQVHVEKLPDAVTRETQHKHWLKVLDRIEAAL